jgi:hypothetical protein
MNGVTCALPVLRGGQGLLEIHWIVLQLHSPGCFISEWMI